MSKTSKSLKNYLYPLNQIGAYTYSQSSSLLSKTRNSKVYMGFNSITEKEVAIKVLDIQGKQKHQKSMIKDEIEMLALFKNCSKIIQVYDIYQTQRHAYIVMEVCDGDLESALLKQNGTGFPQNEAKQIMNQILQGYKQILDKKIIHRDLKTANVFLKNKQIKLADFGYAIKADTSMKNGLRLVKDNAGSPYYMSPQALIKSIYSYKSDIWSLGIIYYQLLVGKVPWKAQTQADLIKQLKQFDINENIPSEISKQSKQFLINTLSISIDLRMDSQQIFQFSFYIENQKRTFNEKQPSKIFKSVQYDKPQVKIQTKRSNPEEKHLGFKVKDILNFDYQQPQSPIKIHKRVKAEKSLEVSYKENLSQVHNHQKLNKKKNFSIQIMKAQSEDQT